MRKRIVIAQAIMEEPEIIILDEPTNETLACIEQIKTEVLSYYNVEN